MPRPLAVLALVLAGIGLAGCLAHEPLAPAEMDAAWRLHDDAWAEAEPKPLTLGRRRLPHTWTLRMEPSLIWSTVSIVKAVERLEEESPETIEVGISPDHAAIVARDMRTARELVLELRELQDPATPLARRDWARTVSRGLVMAETLTRRAAGRAAVSEAESGEDEFGWTVGPMLEMVFAYLDTKVEGGLLDSAADGGVEHVRGMLARAVLRIGFALAGKSEPAELGPEAAEVMASESSPDQVEARLQTMLLEAFDEAPAAPPGSPLPAVIDAVFDYAPTALQVLAGLLDQWDRMESATLSFGERGTETLVAADLAVAEGQEIVFPELSSLQPQLVFRGAGRVVLVPSGPTGEAVIQFDPVEVGGAVVRFEGALWGLVRMAGLPLANVSLRELRVATGSVAGRDLTNVVLVMLARGRDGDLRRVLAYHESAEAEIVRHAFRREVRPKRRTRAVSWLVPGKRYTYRSVEENE